MQNTSKNVRQYHGQNQQGQTMLCKTHRRTSDNTMAKTNKDKQCYTKHIKERQTISWPKPSRTNNVMQNTSTNVRQYHGQNKQGQAMLYKTHRRTSENTMAKTSKDKQCYTKHYKENNRLSNTNLIVSYFVSFYISPHNTIRSTSSSFDIIGFWLGA